MSFLKLFLVVSFFFLSACSSTQSDNTGLTLGDIKTTQPAIKYTTTEVDEVDLIKSYKELLKIARTNKKDDGATLKRLSDISLEHGIDDLLSEDSNTIQQGKNLSNEAIQGYKDYLKQFPNKQTNDEVLYQLAKIYDINGQIKEAFITLLQLDKNYPNSKYGAETKFRIAEYYFSNGSYHFAQDYYKHVIDSYPGSKFFQNSLYKYAWSLIKNDQNENSIYAFLALMDLHYKKGNITKTGIANSISDSQKTLINDILKALNLAITYDFESVKINHYFKQHKKPYEPLIYRSLAQYLKSKNRVNDAATVYFSYLEDNEPTYIAFKLFNNGVQLLKSTTFSELYLKSKKAVVSIFSKPSIFEQFDEDQQAITQPVLARHDYELAKYYHSLAQTEKQKRLAKNYYQIAEKWYSLFLKRFKSNARYGEVSFLLAETLTERKQYLQAAKQYSFSSYRIKLHKQSQEAGYAAILSYQQALKQIKDTQLNYQVEQQLIKASIRYRISYKRDKRSDDIIFNAISRLYDNQQYRKALNILLPILTNKSSSPWLLKEATLLTAHTYFNQHKYLNANPYYLKAIKNTASNKLKKQLKTKLAESYYQLAIQASTHNEHQKSARLYLSSAKTSPVKSVQKIALYDAATQFLIAKNWNQSITLLKSFLSHYKNDKKLYRGAQEKMALAYRSSGNTKQAAVAILALAKNSNKKQQKALLWEAASLFKKDNNEKSMISTYKQYAQQFPLPLERSLKARQIIANYYLSHKQIKTYKQWLVSIINIEHQYTKNGNQEANKIAADSSLALAQYALSDYEKIKLSIPLKKSLAKKKKALKRTIKQFSNTLKYADPETQTLATYGLGEIYRDFANSLLKSERPKNLDADALEEYGYLLEDQAFPFEEKAIKIHSNNFSKTQTGLYNKGIKLSQKSLIELLPFQYDKNEIITPYVAP